MRKCDRPKSATILPSLECCPICTRPAYRVKFRPDGCKFFARCLQLKMDEKPAKSAQERSKAFRAYHAEVCGICKVPLEECRLKKVRKALKVVANAPVTFFSPVGSDEVSRCADRLKCAEPKRDYNPIFPEWYKEK